jgi:hypothetical protein
VFNNVSNATQALFEMNEKDIVGYKVKIKWGNLLKDDLNQNDYVIRIYNRLG